MTKIFSVNELASAQTEWVAVQITVKDYYGKNVTSQRVVKYETYQDLLRKGYTKGHQEIVSVNKLCEPTRNREFAESCLDRPERKVRKTPIDRGDSDYLVSVISLGTISSGGKTKFGWNIWEEGEHQSKLGEDPYIFVLNTSLLLWGAKDSLQIGDKVTLIDNDTRKKVQWGTGTVEYVWNAASKDNFVNQVRNSNSWYSKPRSYSFGRMTDGVKWDAFRTMFSIKGVE